MAAALVTAGVGTIGTTIFYDGIAPDAKSAAIILNQYAGDPPLASFGDPFAAERPGLQVITRSIVADTALDLAYSVMHALGARSDCEVRSHPMYLGQDGKLRHMYSTNYNTLLL
jgi:hypothetical protein